MGSESNIPWRSWTAAKKAGAIAASPIKYKTVSPRMNVNFLSLKMFDQRARGSEVNYRGTKIGGLHISSINFILVFGLPEDDTFL